MSTSLVVIWAIGTLIAAVIIGRYDNDERGLVVAPFWPFVVTLTPLYFAWRVGNRWRSRALAAERRAIEVQDRAAEEEKERRWQEAKDQALELQRKGGGL